MRKITTILGCLFILGVFLFIIQSKSFSDASGWIVSILWCVNYLIKK